MKNPKLVVFISFLVLLTSSSCGYFIKGYVSEEKKRELAGGGSGKAFAPNYNLENIVTITGKVIKIEIFTANLMRVKAVRVFVQTKNRSYETHLGPAWYIEKQPFNLASGDTVTVTGSLVDDKIMIQQFEKDGQLFLIREKNGQPKWFKSVHTDVPKQTK